jgi:hypothetical protein
VLCGDGPQHRVAFQVEDYDSSIPAAVTDETAPQPRNQRDSMSNLLPRNITENLAGLGVDHHGMRASRDKESMRLRIDSEIVPRALTPDRECRDDFPVILRQNGLNARDQD